jgi:putative flippase GtrA
MAIKMRNIYYTIWVDAIVSFRKNNPKRKDWKRYLFFIITFCNALNLFVVILWLKFGEIINIDLEIDIFPGTFIDYAISFVFYFSSPFILLNYFFVFRNNRYERLIAKYPNKNGRFAVYYGLLSVIISYLSVMIYWIIKY